MATWGRTDWQWDATAPLNDQPMPVWNVRNEIVARRLADTCELCGSREQVEVHHVRALKDLDRPGRAAKPAWARVMAARHRKKLVVCHVCHLAITHGRPTRQPDRSAHDTGEPGDANVSSPVLGGGPTEKCRAIGNSPAAYPTVTSYHAVSPGRTIHAGGSSSDPGASTGRRKWSSIKRDGTVSTREDGRAACARDQGDGSAEAGA